MEEMDKCFWTVVELLTKNKITWWLEAGSLLGAVRDGGRIKWDDDYDIGFPRKDSFRVFCALKKLPPEYSFFGGFGYSVIDRNTQEHYICVKPHSCIKGDMYKLQGTVYILFRRVIAKIRGGGPYEIFTKIHINKENDEELVGRKKSLYKKLIQHLYPLMIFVSIFFYTRLRYRAKCLAYSSFISVKFDDGYAVIPSGYKEILIEHYGDYMKPAKKGEYVDLTGKNK